MGIALYRKYRSKSLDEIAGQGHITSTLKNALKSGKISHAYLLTGPRGVGKTSVARILAHAVNDLPYDESTSHLDIIEIDAASNRRIDEIRDLRDKVNLAPARAKYKIYIIDEVHMLTREAFNALLKTLEEPPEHAIFILATTEAHKLPETIISRTQRFTFRPIPAGEIKSYLKNLAKKESIKVDDEALELIAGHSGGSFRDAIGLLDQVGSGSKSITLADIVTLLGVASTEGIGKLVAAIGGASPSEVVSTLGELRDQGVTAPSVAKELSKQLRTALINGKSPLPKDDTLQLLERLLEVSASPEPYVLLEIILLDVALASDSPSDLKEPEIKSMATPKPTAKEAVEKLGPKSDSQLSSDDLWKSTLAEIKKERSTLYSIARMALPNFEDGKLKLTFTFGFHQKRANEQSNKTFIAKTLKNLSGKDYEIVCLLAEGIQPSTANQQSKAVNNVTHNQDETIKNISNIFGQAELLD